jgi:hypothetical protein
MIGCVATMIDDANVREFAAKSMSRASEIVEEQLIAAVATNQLAADFPTSVRARHIVDVSMALALRARVGVSREELFANVDAVVDLILQPAINRRPADSSCD